MSDDIARAGGLSEATEAVDPAALARQVARLGREQLRLNALIEAQQREFGAALQQLREHDERRERQAAEAAARRPAEQTVARLQVIERLLPVLDGLDQALAAGERLAERLPLGVRGPTPSGLPWWVTVLAWPLALAGFLFPRRARRTLPEGSCARLLAGLASWRDSFASWLSGLELVRERLLEALAQEGVQPIEATGRPFDPHRHLAVEVVPAGPGAPPGTVVAELRRGYAAGDRVLRYAEVAVARAL